MDVSHLFHQVIQIKRATGVGLSGDLTRGAAVPIDARVEDYHRLYRNQDGSEVQTSHKIATMTEVKLDDHVWLPGEDPATDQPRMPMKVGHGTDLDGSIGHYEIFLAQGGTS